MGGGGSSLYLVEFLNFFQIYFFACDHKGGSNYVRRARGWSRIMVTDKTLPRRQAKPPALSKVLAKPLRFFF